MSELIFVTGPEASGTRLLSQILIENGYAGDSGHAQRFDSSLLNGEKIVWRRSIPHANRWDVIGPCVKRARVEGYTVKAIVTSREWYSAINTYVAGNKHAATKPEAIEKLRRAYPTIYGDLERFDVPYVIVHYDALISRGYEYLKPVLKVLDIEVQRQVEIKDQNNKWYQQPSVSW